MSIYYKSNFGEGNGNWGYGLKRGREDGDGGCVRRSGGGLGEGCSFIPG
jgi:hypothetical protein